MLCGSGVSNSRRLRISAIARASRATKKLVTRLAPSGAGGRGPAGCSFSRELRFEPFPAVHGARHGCRRGCFWHLRDRQRAAIEQGAKGGQVAADGLVPVAEMPAALAVRVARDVGRQTQIAEMDQAVIAGRGAFLDVALELRESPAAGALELAGQRLQVSPAAGALEPAARSGSHSLAAPARAPSAP